jgi:hypothetical protein
MGLKKQLMTNGAEKTVRTNGAKKVMTNGAEKTVRTNRAEKAVED